MEESCTLLLLSPARFSCIPEFGHQDFLLAAYRVLQSRGRDTRTKCGKG